MKKSHSTPVLNAALHKPHVEEGSRYLQSGYDAARKWRFDGLGYKVVDINVHADNKHNVFGYSIPDYANRQRRTVTTYVQSSLTKLNFHLQTGVKVKRVERELHIGEPRATSVTVMVDNAEKILKIRKGYSTQKGGIIFKVGALPVPDLLKFSRIGPIETLSSPHSAGKLAQNMEPNLCIKNSDIEDELFDNPNAFIEL